MRRVLFLVIGILVMGMAGTLLADDGGGDAILGLWKTEPDAHGFSYVRIVRNGKHYEGRIVYLSKPRYGPDEERPDAEPEDERGVEIPQVPVVHSREDQNERRDRHDNQPASRTASIPEHRLPPAEERHHGGEHDDRDTLRDDDRLQGVVGRSRDVVVPDAHQLEHDPEHDHVSDGETDADAD